MLLCRLPVPARLFPDELALPPLEMGKLYSPPRLLLDDPRRWTPQFDWKRARPTPDFVFAGYFQLFHADDPVLRERPWYDVGYTHAGGGDWYFQQRWVEENKIRPPFNVLHLGPRDRNWFGRTSSRTDRGALPPGIPHRSVMMHAFLAAKNWNGRGHRPADFPERIDPSAETNPP